MNTAFPDHNPKPALSRRDFLAVSTLALGATALTAPALLRGQDLNSKIRVACIGVGGKGDSDTDDSARCGGEIVAICDVDESTLKRKAQKYPQAKLYQSYRKMLEEMEKSIDAVTVSTPDHNHAYATLMAMKMGKHCYTQKPLVQTVYEARLVRQVAKEKKLATQMGNQGSAGSGLRRAVEVIQAGVIGAPRELHVWSNRPVWPQGIAGPDGADPVPETLDWDTWIGPAHMRPFKKGVYHGFAWRGWLDFGTGALGDMACHTVNMPFRALKLGFPTLVEAEEHSGMNTETYAKTSRIRFEFPEREGLPPLKFWWYDGNPRDNSVKPLRPDPEIVKEITALRGDLPASGCLIVGEKGKVFSPDDYGSQFFLLAGDAKEFASAVRRVKEGDNTVDAEHEAIKDVPKTLPRSPGHNREWFNAMKDGKPELAYSNFDIAAYLTEIILLGCIALRVGKGKPMEWDGPNMKSPNRPEAAQFVKRAYRKGWEL